MATPNLKLVEPRLEDTDSLFLERRQASRQAMAGRATALVRQDSALEPRRRICSLQLLNISDTGLGAISETAIAPGTSISVFFPPHGSETGFDLHGRVVRCVSREWGHEIGIQLRSIHIGAA